MGFMSAGESLPPLRAWRLSALVQSSPFALQLKDAVSRMIRWSRMEDVGAKTS
jgi:hypothetical protein